MLHICNFQQLSYSKNWVGSYIPGMHMQISDTGTGEARGRLPLPQYLANQLTLFQPEEADYPHLLHATGTPKVFHPPTSLQIR